MTNINLNIIREGDKIIVKDLMTLQLIIGASSVCGNYSYYGVEKRDDKTYAVSIKRLRERINELKFKKANLDKRLDIMEQVLRENQDTCSDTDTCDKTQNGEQNGN